MPAASEVARRQIEHRQILPGPGWVEHDPIEIAARVDEVIAGALRTAGLTGRDLAAIGITNQRETTVVWDPRTGRPWHNAIVWQDTRTADLVAHARRRSASGSSRETGPAAGHLLLVAEAALDARQRRGPARGRARRPRALRHRGHLGDLEPDRRDRRRPARHRRHQRQPHAADEPAHARLGRRAARAVRHPAPDAAGDLPLVHVRARTERRARMARSAPRSRSPATSAISMPRSSARRASQPARRRTPTAPATSCCSTPATRWCPRRRAC